MKLALVILTFLFGTPVGDGKELSPSTLAVSRAKQLMIDGGRSLELQDFGNALAKFNEAMTLVPNAKIEFGIGLAREGLGQHVLAYEAFTRYLSGPDENRERQKEASKRQGELRNRVILLDVSSAVSDGLLAIDGGARVPLPLPRPVVLEPGEHKVIVKANGMEWTELIAGVAGESYVLAPRSERRPPIDQSSLQIAVPASSDRTKQEFIKTEPVRSNHRIWLWTAAAALVAITTTAILLSSGSTTQRACSPDIECINAQ